MKIEIQYLIEGELGRKAWVKDTDQGLVFGNIYTQEKDASNLSESQVNWLLSEQGFKYLVSKIVF